jgi:hypothetical protein
LLTEENLKIFFGWKIFLSAGHENQTVLLQEQPIIGKRLPNKGENLFSAGSLHDFLIRVFKTKIPFARERDSKSFLFF